MSQAQRKNLEQSAPVRTLPPPLPRKSHIAEVASKPRSTPLPPMAADRRLPPATPSRAPALSVPPPAHLAIVPLWDDANLPLRPAPKQGQSSIHWIGSTTVGLAVGALVAASLMTVRLGDYAQILPYGSAARGLQAPPVQAELPAAAVLPVQVFDTDEPLEIQLDEVEQASEPIIIPELTVTSREIGTAAKATKQAKIGPVRKAPKHRGKRNRTMVADPGASQPDPQAEVKLESANVEPPAPEPAPAATETTATPEAAAPEPAAPEPAAPEVVEPPAPALPEKLTRGQVRAGLDKVRAQVLACAKGTYGKVLADVTISAPGQVSSALIEGTFAGTKAGSCMETTIRAAKFPAFSGPDISVRYPYSF